MKINWSNVTVSGKELMAVIVFVFSMSGIYYKLFYNNDMQRMELENYRKLTDVRLKTIEDNQKIQTKIFDVQIKVLMEDYTGRRAIEDFKNSNEYVPLTRKK